MNIHCSMNTMNIRQNSIYKVRSDHIGMGSSSTTVLRLMCNWSGSCRILKRDTNINITTCVQFTESQTSHKTSCLKMSPKSFSSQPPATSWTDEAQWDLIFWWSVLHQLTSGFVVCIVCDSKAIEFGFKLNKIWSNRIELNWIDSQRNETDSFLVSETPLPGNRLSTSRPRESIQFKHIDLSPILHCVSRTVPWTIYNNFRCCWSRPIWSYHIQFDSGQSLLYR